jgi:N-acyl-D-amino-acid deacylase
VARDRFRDLIALGQRDGGLIDGCDLFDIALPPPRAHPRRANQPTNSAIIHVPMADRYDLLIENGTVVDGTGADRYAATVGVRHGRLQVLREAKDATAERRIDASGLVVAPGFIDLHSHSGLMIFAEPLHEPKVRQGVTTEVIGVDGLSYAPIPDPADLEALVEMNAGLDGAPREARPHDWSSVE